MQNKRLSLCMIVKDEGQLLEKSLNSVKDYVDEMIIVDMGSPGRIVEKCKQFSTQIFKFPWNGSFSDARNFGLEQATGDWILWLNPGEEVDKQDAKKLREILAYDDLVLFVRRIDYYIDQAYAYSTKKIQMEMRLPRLFQNHKGFKFMYKVHEMLNIEEVYKRHKVKQKFRTVPITIHHYNVVHSFIKQIKESEETIKIIKEEIKQAEHSPWLEYFLANEFYRQKKFQEAFAYVNHSIQGFLKELKIPPAVVYRLKYLILINGGSLENILPGIERALILYPEYVELHYLKGIVQFSQKMYEEALETFNHCLQLGEESIYMIMKGVGSFYALYYKGLCYEKLGDIKSAVKSFIEAAEISPAFELPMEELRKLLNKHKKYFENIPEDLTTKHYYPS